MTDDHASLVASLRRGDRGAAEAFVAHFAPRVLAWVLRLGGPGLDAEDLSQEVFATFFLRLESFRGDARPTTWLFGITRNHVRNARRRAAFRRFLHLDDAPPPTDDRPGPDDVVERLRRRELVQRVLVALPDREREVLVLADFDDLPAGEVAAILGIPVGTVHSRLYKARRLFGERLRAEGAADLRLVPAMEAKQ